MATESKVSAARTSTARTSAATASTAKGSKARAGSTRTSKRGKQQSPLLEESPDTLRDYYHQMVLIRRFEERAGEMYTRAKIGGYCHLNLGEEATVVGLMSALEPQDYLFTTYREHGYALARGIEPGRVMAELFGKTTGVSFGWGGSMHLFDAEKRLLGGYGIVGGQIPPATGAAFAIQYKGGDEVVMCLLGDATTNIGAFHESLNLAALWKLPIVYVIINNQLGMGTPVEAHAAEPELYKRGCSYRMPGERVDGNDPLAVREATRKALNLARHESQPSILEAVSYRLRGHSVVDPAKYRSKEEVERLRQADPVLAFRKELLDAKVLDEAAVADVEREVEDEVNAAVEFADSSPDPSPEQLYAKAYATPVPNAPQGFPGDPIVPAAKHETS